MVIVTIHAILGLIILILAVIASIVEIVRGRNGAKNPLRGPLIGLLDLQILLGIVTIIWTSHYGSFLFHPIIMVIAAILFHGWTKATKSASTRIPAYVISTILLIVGAVLFY